MDTRRWTTPVACSLFSGLENGLVQEPSGVYCLRLGTAISGNAIGGNAIGGNIRFFFEDPQTFGACDVCSLK